ncbi:MAG: hypothetical protein JWM32_2947 [Verrucomicrobia bacterium]|nr:hypothetical protein [Verrucomicrobiota bacterium]
MITPDLSPVTIALVDDHPGIRRGLQLILHLHGFAPRVYASAEGFLSSNQIDDAACLLLDVRMPGMSGLELQSRLKLDGHDVPIIILTNDANPATEEIARQAGAVGYLLKSAPPDTLVAAIRKVVGCARRTNPLAAVGAEFSTSTVVEDFSSAQPVHV